MLSSTVPDQVKVSCNQHDGKVRHGFLTFVRSQLWRRRRQDDAYPAGSSVDKPPGLISPCASAGQGLPNWHRASRTQHPELHIQTKDTHSGTKYKTSNTDVATRWCPTSMAMTSLDRRPTEVAFSGSTYECGLIGPVGIIPSKLPLISSDLSLHRESLTTLAICRTSADRLEHGDMRYFIIKFEVIKFFFLLGSV